MSLERIDRLRRPARHKAGLPRDAIMAVMVHAIRARIDHGLAVFG